MKSFRDPATNILKAYGYMDANAPGDLSRDEAEGFNLEPGKWRLADGAWVAVPADLWIEIKAERDRRKAGGWMVGGNWFHSDEPSRTQYGTLLTTAIEKSLPTEYLFNQNWKTMSGAFVPMTVALVRQIRDVGLMTESDLFTAAERMKAGDATAVWPAIYGG